MSNIENQVMLAKTDPSVLEQLLKDYLPFIKKQLIPMKNSSLEYDDILSLSMISFLNSIKQYEPGKGSFLAFAAVCIKNRIIDEERRQIKYSSHILSLQTDKEELAVYLEESAAAVEYRKTLERESFTDEIEVLTLELKKCNIALSELAKICPKQKNSRKQCLLLAKIIAENPNMSAAFLKSYKLPQSELAALSSISLKTIEKFRKYIVAVTIIFLGDYPYIKTFLSP